MSSTECHVASGAIVASGLHIYRSHYFVSSIIPQLTPALYCCLFLAFIFSIIDMGIGLWHLVFHLKTVYRSRVASCVQCVGSFLGRIACIDEAYCYRCCM